MSELSLTRQCDVANNISDINISDSNISDINVSDIKIRVRSWKCNCWNNLKRKLILLVSLSTEVIKRYVHKSICSRALLLHYY